MADGKWQMAKWPGNDGFERWIGFSAARIESFVDSSRAPEKIIFI